MIPSNQTGYLCIPTMFLGKMVHLERGQIEQILFLPCLNDLYFLYKRVINALDSSYSMKSFNPYATEIDPMTSR